MIKICFYKRKYIILIKLKCYYHSREFRLNSSHTNWFIVRITKDDVFSEQ